jgi:hypothetical protein
MIVEVLFKCMITSHSRLLRILEVVVEVFFHVHDHFSLRPLLSYLRLLIISMMALLFSTTEFKCYNEASIAQLVSFLVAEHVHLDSSCRLVFGAHTFLDLF